MLIASHAGDLDAVKKLLEEGCDPNFFEDCSDLTDLLNRFGIELQKANRQDLDDSTICCKQSKPRISKFKAPQFGRFDISAGIFHSQSATQYCFHPGAIQFHKLLAFA